MPELPEVETVCRGLAQHILSRKITATLLRRQNLRIPFPKNFESTLQNRTITNISRRAKYILIHLDNKQVLIVHLGMSGSLVLYEKNLNDYRKHDHVVFTLTPALWIVFHDPRRFGLMTITSEKEMAQHAFFSSLGPEPFDKALDKDFYPTLQKSKAPIKSVIMDQQKIVGVGNIYACEALFRSKIHPTRPAHKVTKKEAALLLDNIRKTLNEAIESGGSTLRDYVRSSGDSGYFQHHFRVYGRAKQRCLICKTPISVIRQAGRSTFFCPHCQK